MDDSFRSKLVDAMKSEDSKLKEFIGKAQLEAWYRTTRDCAEKTVAHALDRITKAKEASKNGNGVVLFGTKRLKFDDSLVGV